jgi:hypothetical protein
MLTFTLIRNNRGPLSKSFTLHEGQLKKTAAADLVDGIATRVAVADLHQFARLLEGLGNHEALTFGITQAEQARLTPRALKSLRGRNTKTSLRRSSAISFRPA